MPIADFVRKHYERYRSTVAKKQDDVLDACLSEDEKILLYVYTEDSRPLNGSLYEGRFSPFQSKMAQFIEDALRKLPPHRGTVYRGINLSHTELQKYQNAESQGTIITEPAFISTSIKVSEARQFYKFDTKNNRVPFDIECYDGKNISILSANSEENEILLNRNTSFRVTEITHDDGIYFISMKQL